MVNPEKGSDRYDIAIIGGGIAGAAVARDAALRGARVVLFEKNTFGSGTSSKSSKLIHGGLRYLEVSWKAFKRGHWLEAWKNFRFVLCSLKEAKILESIAPSIVKPFEILIPIYSSDKRNRFVIIAGTLLYGLLAVCTGKSKAPRILWTRSAVLKQLPLLNPQGLKGGIILHDRITDDERLVQATITSAKKKGADVYEHTRVVRYEYDKKNETYEIKTVSGSQNQVYRARKLVNATGPWVDSTRELGNERGKDLIFPVAGAHLTLKKFLPLSTLLQAEDGRIFFVINIDETSRVGTTERFCPDPDQVRPTDKEVEYLLRSLKHYFPDRNLGKEDILSQEAGVRPLARPDKETDQSEISREHRICVDPSGVIHLLGVKLTDHRRAAQELVDKIIQELALSKPELKRKSSTHLKSLEDGSRDP